MLVQVFFCFFSPVTFIDAPQVLLALTLAVVVSFQTSARLGLAYGLAVNCGLLLTTFFLTLVRFPIPSIPMLVKSGFERFKVEAACSLMSLCPPLRVCKPTTDL